MNAQPSPARSPSVSLRESESGQVSMGPVGFVPGIRWGQVWTLSFHYLCFFCNCSSSTSPFPKFKLLEAAQCETTEGGCAPAAAASPPHRQEPSPSVAICDSGCPWWGPGSWPCPQWLSHAPCNRRQSEFLVYWQWPPVGLADFPSYNDYD